MKKLVFLWVINILLFVDASAYPDTQIQEIYYDIETDESWSVFPDSSQSGLYYRFPSYYEISIDEQGYRLIQSRYLPNGNLQIQFFWEVKNWKDNHDTLVSLIESNHQKPVQLSVLIPEITSIYIDQGLLENYHADIKIPILNELPAYLTPDSSIMTSLTIPKDHIFKFVERVVELGGFSFYIQQNFIIENDVGFDKYPYATAFLLGGVDFCHILPELSCGVL